jgi:hypothetical protein
MDKGLEFEYWVRYTLPWQLNLSPSKACGVELKFGRFADTVRPLVSKAPAEFERFFGELRRKVEGVYHFRAPRGYRAYPVVFNGDFVYYPNGKIRYSIQKNNF